MYVYVTGGIPYTDNIDKLHDLRAFLLEIFDEFGPEPESVEIPPGKGFARMKVCVCVYVLCSSITCQRGECMSNRSFTLILILRCACDGVYACICMCMCMCVYVYVCAIASIGAGCGERHRHVSQLHGGERGRPQRRVHSYRGSCSLLTLQEMTIRLRISQ